MLMLETIFKDCEREKDMHISGMSITNSIEIGKQHQRMFVLPS